MLRYDKPINVIALGVYSSLTPSKSYILDNILGYSARSMLTTLHARTLTRLTTRALKPLTSSPSIIIRNLQTTPSPDMSNFPEGHKDQSKPPPHEMIYFKGLTKEVREFGVFRKVLHTSMYSQLVAMEIPVGGDIGDEVHTVDQTLIFTA